MLPGYELVKKLKAFWFVINKLKLSATSMINSPKIYNHDKETELFCEFSTFHKENPCKGIDSMGICRN